MLAVWNRASGDDPETVQLKLQDALAQLSAWSAVWGMPISQGKTSVMRIGKKGRGVWTPELQFDDGEDVEQVTKAIRDNFKRLFGV